MTISVGVVVALVLGCGSKEPKPGTGGSGSGSGAGSPVATAPEAASWKLGGLDVPVTFIPKALGALPLKPGAPYRLSDFPDDPPNWHTRSSPAMRPATRRRTT